MTTARYPEGLSFRELRRGRGTIESLVLYTADERYMILPSIDGITPKEWRIYSLLEGDFLADEDGEILVFDSQYDAKGRLIHLYANQ
jgi:hypothetical protein